MPFSRTLRPLAFAVLLACSGSVLAAGGKTVFQPSKKIEYSPEELKAERERRTAIVDHTQNIFSLLSAEMAYNQGRIETAIGLYLTTLRQTKDPDVAERAMELAIIARAYPVAEMVYTEWRKIEPEPGPAQRRLGLLRAFALGDTPTVLTHFDSVLAEADETQRRRLFMLAATTGMVHPALVLHAGTTVHRAAQQHPELAEAAIADAIYSAYAKREDKAVAALDRLAALDADITPPTRLTVELLAQTRPEIFNRFFERRQNRSLPTAWRELEIDSLMTGKRYTEAQNKLQSLLGESDDARLHLQAATLAIATGGSEQTILGHLEKAYQSGTGDLPSRAALIAAVHLSGQEKHGEAAAWADKIKAAELAFDRLALQASLAAGRNNWHEARRHALAAEKLSDQSGHFFSAADVQRIKLHAAGQILPPEQTLAELNRAYAKAERQPNSPEQTAVLSAILYQRGLLYSDRLQQHGKAVADFRRFVSLNPGHANGMNALGYTLLSGSPAEIEEGYNWIREAHRLEPDSPQILDSLGWAHYKKGDPAAALPHLQAAYAKDPDPEIAAHLGAALWALGRQDEARRIWQEGRRKDPKHKVLNQILNRHNITLP